MSQSINMSNHEFGRIKFGSFVRIPKFHAKLNSMPSFIAKGLAIDVIGCGQACIVTKHVGSTLR